MLLEDYLRRFAAHRRITLVGPMQTKPLYPARPQPKPVNTQAEPLIWVDGGANHRHGKTGFAVGDGDSALCDLDQYLSTDKDYSDLAYVLRCLPAHFDEVILLGFLGARYDHQLFNFGEVHHFLRDAKTPTQVRFEHSIQVYSQGEWTFTARGVFSLAVFEPSTVQLLGACQFPITTPTVLLPLSSLGLSNRGFGEVTLQTQCPAFIFKPNYNATV